LGGGETKPGDSKKEELGISKKCVDFAEGKYRRSKKNYPVMAYFG